jgi:lysine biosynthesis protein LysW
LLENFIQFKDNYKVMNKNNVKVKCTECENEFDINAESEIGDKVECPACGMTFEVVQIEPSITIEPVTLDK